MNSSQKNFLLVIEQVKTTVENVGTEMTNGTSDNNVEHSQYVNVVQIRNFFFF